MNNLHPDLALQIYSLLSDDDLWKLTSTDLWSHLASILLSDVRRSMFWRSRVGVLLLQGSRSQDKVLSSSVSESSLTLPLSSDTDWKLVYRFVTASNEHSNILRSLSQHGFNLKSYSDAGGLVSAIENDNLEATAILLQIAQADGESMRTATRLALCDYEREAMATLLAEHLGDEESDEQLKSRVVLYRRTRIFHQVAWVALMVGLAALVVVTLVIILAKR